MIGWRVILFVSAIPFESRNIVADLFLDEELGKLFKAQPPTEDAYIFRSNGPHD